MQVYSRCYFLEIAENTDYGGLDQDADCSKIVPAANGVMAPIRTYLKNMLVTVSIVACENCCGLIERTPQEE